MAKIKIMYKILIAIGIIIAILVLVWPKSEEFKTPINPKKETIITIQLPPPPPPPVVIPPKLPEKVEEPKEEMVPQEKVEEKEVKSEEPKKVDEPPPIGTSITGNGPPDGFGLSTGNGIRGKGTGMIGGKTGSKFGWYAADLQTKIKSIVRTDEKLRTQRFLIICRIWLDKTGRIEKVSVPKFPLDTQLKSAIVEDLKLDPPPNDMPMPIVLKIELK